MSEFTISIEWLKGIAALSLTDNVLEGNHALSASTTLDALRELIEDRAELRRQLEWRTDEPPKDGRLVVVRYPDGWVALLRWHGANVQWKEQRSAGYNDGFIAWRPISPLLKGVT